jgi:hypothetical protein
MVHHFLQLHLALRHVGSERVSLREPLLLVDVRHSSAVSRPTSKTMAVEHVDPDLVVLWLEMAAWQTAGSLLGFLVSENLRYDHRLLLLR